MARFVALLFILAFPAVAQAAQSLTSPPFDAPVVVADYYSRIIETPDLNGDGYADGVSWWEGQTPGTLRLRTFINDGSGTLQLQWTDNFPMAGFEDNLNASAKGNLNGDGFEDVVLSVGQTVAIFFATGGPQLGFYKFLNEPEAVYDIEIGDFNNDGLNDIALIEGTLLRIYLNGGHAFTNYISTPTWFAGVGTDLIKIDVNGDSQMDLAFVQYDGLFLVPIVNGVIQPLQKIPLYNAFTTRIAGGDIDNDGDSDIVAFYFSDYIIFRRTGPSTFVAEPVHTGGTGSDFTDIDNDGDLDAVSCDAVGGDSNGVNTEISQFRISRNEAGLFLPVEEFISSGARRLAGAVDLDHDGDIDLVAGRSVLYGNGPVKAGASFKMPYIGEIDRASINDYDSDGDLDINFSIYSVKSNDGTGKFASKGVLYTLPAAGSVYVGPGLQGDFTNDGFIDLIVAKHSGSSSGPFQEMHLLKNMSGGALVDGGACAPAGINFNLSQTPTNYYNHPVASIVADFDGDGDQDLLMHSHQASTMSSYLFVNIGNGTGTFYGAQFFNNVQAVDVGDFDGDGKLDILAGTQAFFPGTNADLRVHLNNGNNTFMNGNSLGSEYAEVSLGRASAGDFDHDGILDFAYIAAQGTRPVVQKNLGGAVFQHIYPFPLTWALTAPFVIFGADLDHDGATEMIFSAVQNVNLGVSITTYNGSYWNEPVIQGGTLSALADFDGDGFVDIVGVRSDAYDNATRIIYNRHYKKPEGGLRRQFGQSTYGTGGFYPTLGIAGPFIQNAQPEFRMTGVVGGAPVLFVVGLSESNIINHPFVGLTSYADPWMDYAMADAAGAPGVGGAGTVAISIVVTPQLAGQTFYIQGYAYDPGVPGLFVQTNGLQITFGL